MRRTETAGQMSLFHQDQREMPTTTATTRKDKCPSISIYKVSLVREGKMRCYDKRIRGSADASDLLHRYLESVDREHFVILMLDRKNQLIGINTVSIGSLSASIVHLRETFKPAILCNAASIICCHNHPSGSPEPSHEDRALTKRLVEAGKLLGIDVLDHIILGDGTGSYYSFGDEGIL